MPLSHRRRRSCLSSPDFAKRCLKENVGSPGENGTFQGKLGPPYSGFLIYVSWVRVPPGLFHSPPHMDWPFISLLFFNPEQEFYVLSIVILVRESGIGAIDPSQICRRTSTDVKKITKSFQRVKNHLNESHDDRIPCFRRMCVCREPKKK